MPAPFGVYVHIPFCLVRCPYCDFNAYAGMDDLIEPYVAALVSEIRSAEGVGPASSVFFGGGTPTQVPPDLLIRILEAIDELVGIDEGAEVTVEANPETAERRALASLRSGGFNRVSVGVQSLVPEVLRRLGRAHSAERALRAIADVRAGGFERISADLIYGTPGETLEDWSESLERVLDLGPGHLSCYGLTVEDGTPLASWVERGLLAPPDEDDQAEKYEVAHEVLESAGMSRYEVSNWALPGQECRHNLLYWRGGNYRGFGAGAHSHRSGRRSWNLRNPRTYIEKSPEVEEGAEELSQPGRAEERAVLGLRTAEGLNRADFTALWGVDPLGVWPEALAGLEEEGLLEITETSVRPTSRGFLFHSRMAGRLLLEDRAAPIH